MRTINIAGNPLAVGLFVTVIKWCFVVGESAGPTHNMSNKERHELKFVYIHISLFLDIIL